MISIKNVTLHFGGLKAVDGTSFDIPKGTITGLIGPNGAGKTTFVAQLSGLLTPDAGKIIFDGRDVTNLSAPRRSQLGLARSFQITSIFRNFTVIENVALSIQAHAGHSFRFWRPTKSDPELIGPAHKLLDEIGLGARADIIASNLAHGEQRQLEIAMALATGPKLLLLDEPTAGMGPEDSERIREFLAGLKTEVIT